MIVFPMAGLGSRFVKAGYEKPKWMLPLADRSVLYWAVKSFSSYFNSEPFVFAHRNDDGVSQYIRDCLTALGVGDARLVEISGNTRGQADTVRIALQQVDSKGDEQVTIFNVDTIRPNYRRSPLLSGSQGWIECFRGKGDHWSFVEPSPKLPNRVERVAEKVRISDLCCTGLYYFSSSELFFDLFSREEADPVMSELYVAPLLQRLVADHSVVTYSVIERDDVIFSGTPEEYEKALENSRSMASRFQVHPASL